ncbi:substrate-binding domain-containing protein [Vibrio sp. PP-XX7]
MALQHGASAEVLDGIRQGNLDVGFYSEAGVPDPSLSTWEVGHFGIYLAAAPGVIDLSQPIDWKVLEGQPWICPAASTCCGKVAEHLFRLHDIRPEKMISVDRENVTRTLIAGGVGIGLLHTSTAQEARLLGEVELICEAQKSAKILCVYRQRRANEPLLNAVTAILRSEL